MDLSLLLISYLWSFHNKKELMQTHFFFAMQNIYCGEFIPVSEWCFCIISSNCFMISFFSDFAWFFFLIYLFCFVDVVVVLHFSLFL